MALKCESCGKKFRRRRSDYNRSLRKGHRNFCSRKCAGRANVGNIPESSRVWGHLDPGNKADELSPFRWHLRNCKRRKDCDLTLEDLRDQWDKQDGRCPYSGWKLKNLATTSCHLPLTPDRASLDRIDSSKGYVQGNVQFVSYMAQCAKNIFSGDDLIKFCESVIINQAGIVK